LKKYKKKKKELGLFNSQKLGPFLIACRKK